MSFPKYSKYKHSGTEWLGEVPDSWRIRPLWTLFRRTKRTGHRDEQLLSVYRDYGVIPKASREDNNNKPSDDLSAYQFVEPGDLVVNKMKAWQGSVAISGYRGIVSPAYFVYGTGHQEDARYLHYLFRSPRYITGYLSISKGIRVNQWDLEPQYHSRMPVVLPSLSEQCAIASFLDQETVKIDTLLSEQEKLIALLSEKRRATTSHAVRFGVNPTVPMKDSGAVLLGHVPAHWDVGPVKRFFTSLDGKRIPLTAEDRGLRPGDYPYYGASGIIDSINDYIFDEDLVLVSEDGANLLNRSTPIAFVATGMYWVNNHAHILKPNDNNLVFWSERIEALDLAPVVTGSAQPKLTIEALMNLVIAVPPTVKERASIAAFINTETFKLDALTAKAQRAVTLLKERRSALIAAAVTGEIDVRAASPQSAQDAIVA